jgi:hypothetical protein
LLAVVLVATGLPAVWRLGVFLPLWISALGFFQAKDKTGVRLAARGLRDLDDGAGACPIQRPAELAQVRRQALWVHVQSFVAAAVVTGLLFVL